MGHAVLHALLRKLRARGGGAEPPCASEATMSAWPRGNAPTASCAWRQAWGVGKASTSGGCGGMAVYGKGAVGASAWVASGEAGPWACASKGDNRARQASRMGHDGAGDGEKKKMAGARMAISRQRTKKHGAAARWAPWCGVHQAVADALRASEIRRWVV